MIVISGYFLILRMRWIHSTAWCIKVTNRMINKGRQIKVSLQGKLVVEDAMQIAVARGHDLGVLADVLDFKLSNGH